MRKQHKQNQVICNPVAQARNHWNLVVWRWERWTQPAGFMHPAVIFNASLLVLCEAGSAKYFVGANEHLVEPGTMILLPAEQAFCYEVQKAAPFQHCLVQVDIRDGHNVSPFTLNLLPGICRLKSLERAKKLFADIENTMSSDRISDYLRISAATMELFAIFCEEGASKHQTITRSVGKAFEAMSIIEKRFRSPLSIKEIANQLRITPEYLAVSFKKTFRISPKQQIRNLRLTYAASLLRTTGMLVKEIAAETGFKSVSVFEDAFLQYFKCSPSGLHTQKMLSGLPTRKMLSSQKSQRRSRN
ncbi:MAG: hypothetical protein BGO12_04365 [Verrucomicrobia bacterium 61-8]|nr:MAG: hypothetical protein BGO12_04365 [Verrucomicrobia bacterium 61-8]